MPIPYAKPRDGKANGLQLLEGSGDPDILFKNGIKIAIILIIWEIWKERNARVFDNKFTMSSMLFQRIRDEGKNWILIRATKLAEIIG